VVAADVDGDGVATGGADVRGAGVSTVTGAAGAEAEADPRPGAVRACAGAAGGMVCAGPAAGGTSRGAAGASRGAMLPSVVCVAAGDAAGAVSLESFVRPANVASE